MNEPEFEVGKVVTVDRYNHIDDVEVVPIVGYGRMPVSNRLTYKFRIGGISIETTGVSIMESKFYEPVPDHERHQKKFSPAGKAQPKNKFFAIFKK